MAETPEQREVELRIAWDLDAAFPPPLYTNYMGASFTPEDFTLLLGWYAPPISAEVSPDGGVDARVQPVARVVLPLNLLRNVIALLERQVEAYERSFGPIPAHPNPPAWMSAKEEETADHE
jgi:hypothetical protein